MFTAFIEKDVFLQYIYSFQFLKTALKFVPVGWIATGEHIAEAIAFLADRERLV